MTTISSTQDKGRLLRSALLGNSIFSLLSGLDFVLFSRPISKFIGNTAPTVILVLGIILIAFAAELYLLSRVEKINRFLVWAVIISDVLWVIASAVLIFTDLVQFTSAGNWALAVIADIVLVFAILQYVGLRKASN